MSQEVPSRQMSTPKDAMSCDGCRYAQPVVTRSESLIMECFRYPAQLLVVNDELVQARPDADYRCGEYRDTVEVIHDHISDMLHRMREGALEARLRREGKGDGSSTHPSSS